MAASHGDGRFLRIIVVTAVVVLAITGLTAFPAAARSAMAAAPTKAPAKAPAKSPASEATIAPPVITSVAPNRGPDAGGTRVTITGSNFVAVKAVRFGSVNGKSVKVLSRTRLQVTAPRGSTGVVNVRVVTSYATSAAVRADQYRYDSNTLSAGQSLAPGQALLSTDDRYSAVMQSGGNFVVSGPGGKTLWASRTRTRGSHIIMQTDGNLVVYAPGGKALWSSSTAPSTGDRLVLQTDGNLVIYSKGGLALWDYGSGIVGSPGTLSAGQGLNPGQALVSTDGRYAAAMQTDGNFVVYGPGGAIWASHTGTPGSVIIMQTDGNLVIYAPGGKALWWTSTAPSTGDYLVMQTDGNLVIYTQGGHALWDYGSGVLSSWAGASFCTSFANSYYRGNSYQGVASCGGPLTGTISYNGVVFDKDYGWNCVELADRWFYAQTGLTPGYPPTGADTVAYLASRFPRYAAVPGSGGTSTFSSSIAPGDIISMWGGASAQPDGHVAIVTSVNVSGGNGTIGVLEENGSASGLDSITVSGGQMSFGSPSYLGGEYYYTSFQWLTGL